MEGKDDKVTKKIFNQITPKAFEKKDNDVLKKNEEHRNKKLARKVIKEHTDENLDKRQRTGPLTRGRSNRPKSPRIQQENIRGKHPETTNEKMSQNKMIKMEQFPEKRLINQ